MPNEKGKRLTKDQWDDAYRQWLSDPSMTFAKLAGILGVSKAAISRYSKVHGWRRVNKGKSKAVNKKREQLTKAARVKIKDAEPSIQNEMMDLIRGRSKYQPSFDNIANKMCKLGATDAELAEAFVVDESTINRWKLAFPAFQESIRRGRIYADIEVAEGLYKRACGYVTKEVRTKRMAVPDAKGEIQMCVIEDTVIEKEIPPDTQAAFLWLHNRRPQNWRHKVEVENSHVLDSELIDKIKNDYLVRLEKARERQRQVYIERGITIDYDD